MVLKYFSGVWYLKLESCISVDAETYNYYYASTVIDLIHVEKEW